MPLTLSELLTQVEAAYATAAPEDTTLQVAIFWSDQERETATYVDDDGLRAEVVAPSYAICTLHRPGGYVARGGTHWDDQYEIRAVRPDEVAQEAMTSALGYAFENLSVSSWNDDDDLESVF